MNDAFTLRRKRRDFEALVAVGVARVIVDTRDPGVSLPAAIVPPVELAQQIETNTALTGEFKAIAWSVPIKFSRRYANPPTWDHEDIRQTLTFGEYGTHPVVVPWTAVLGMNGPDCSPTWYLTP